MNRKEKIDFLRNNGVEINDKANSSRVEKKFKELTDYLMFKKIDAEKQKRNKRRNERKKNEEIKKQNLKNVERNNKRTVTCYNCRREFKRSQTVHEFLIMKYTKERISSRFCINCHVKILDHMKKGI